MKIKKQKSAQDISVRQAQDRQDEIFRKMSAEESIKLASNFYRFGQTLNLLGNDYDGTRRTFKGGRKNSG